MVSMTEKKTKKDFFGNKLKERNINTANITQWNNFGKKCNRNTPFMQKFLRAVLKASLVISTLVFVCPWVWGT